MASNHIRHFYHNFVSKDIEPFVMEMSAKGKTLTSVNKLSFIDDKLLSVRLPFPFYFDNVDCHFDNGKN